MTNTLNAPKQPACYEVCITIHTPSNAMPHEQERQKKSFRMYEIPSLEPPFLNVFLNAPGKPFSMLYSTFASKSYFVYPYYVCNLFIGLCLTKKGLGISSCSGSHTGGSRSAIRAANVLPFAGGLLSPSAPSLAGLATPLA